MGRYGPRAKSPRLQWDWPPEDKFGVKKKGYRRYIEDIKICNNLTSIFSEILDMPLQLHMTNNQQSVEAYIDDKGNIHIPKMHPKRVVILKHELSHPAFGSDFEKRVIFLDWIIKTVDPYNRLDDYTVNALKEDAAFIQNIFEDERVNSLWGRLYPGDGRKLSEWTYGEVGPELFRKARKKYKNNIDNASLYIILVLLNQPAKSTKWEKYKDRILKAKEDVKFRDFDGGLVVCKDLILDIIKDLIEPPPPKQPKQKSNQQSSQGQSGQQQQQSPKGQNQQSSSGQAQQQNSPNAKSSGNSPSPAKTKTDQSTPFRKDNATQAIKQYVNLGNRAKSGDITSQNAGFNYDKINKTAPGNMPAKKVKEVEKLLSMMGDKKQKFLVKSKIKAIERAQFIEAKSVSSSANKQVKSGDTLNKLESKFKVTQVKRGTQIDVNPSILRAANKMKKLFMEIKRDKVRKDEMEGPTLIMPAVIQNRIALMNRPYYEQEKSSMGFELFIVLDISSSMRSSQTQLETLFTTLRLATKDIKELDVTVFAFSQTEPGWTNIFEFPITLKGIFDKDMSICGGTPMAQSLCYLKDRLQSSTVNKQKSVLFIGDGFPVFQKEDGTSIKTENLMWWCRHEIESITKSGIPVFALMVGYSLPSDDDMNQMFLTRNNWVKLEDRSKLLEETNKFIKSQFVTFLKK